MLKQSLLFCLLLVSQFVFSQTSESKKAIIREIIKEKLHLPTGKPIHSIKGTNSFLTQRSNQEIKLSDATTLDVSEAEPYIAINPTDTNNIVVAYMDFTVSLDFRIYYTLDGGATWQKSSFNPGEIFTQTNPLLVIGGGGDPIMDFDKNGKLYFSWLYLGVEASFTDARFLVFWAWSDNKGADFQTAKGDDLYISKGGLSLTTGDLNDFGDGIFDRPWLAVDRSDGPNAGTLYCLGLFIPNNKTTLAGGGIVLKRKLPNQDKFEYANTEVYNSENVQFSNVAVDEAGVIHASFGELSDSTIKYTQSIDGGLSFVTASDIGFVKSTYQSGTTFIHSRENPAPNIALEPGTNNIYIVWSSFGIKPLIQGFLSKSLDGGLTWSTPKDLSVLSNDTLDHFLMPVVSAGIKTGVVVSWYSVNTLKQSSFKVMRSLDNAETFETPITVTSKITDFSVYPTGAVFFGDYNKSINTQCRNLTIFSDGRESLGPKIYISVVDYCNTSAIGEISTITDKISLKLLPNHFKNHTNLQVTSKQNEQIKLSLLDQTGKEIQSIFDGKIQGGINTFTLELTQDIPAGIYFILLKTEVGIFVQKCIKE